MKTADPTLLNDADFAVQVTPERAEKPSSRWRNVWRVLVPCRETGEPPVGTVYPDMDTWPSQEICEQKAREEIEWDIRDTGMIIDDWVGAFPEGERP